MPTSSQNDNVTISDVAIVTKALTEMRQRTQSYVDVQLLGTAERVRLTRDLHRIDRTLKELGR